MPKNNTLITAVKRARLYRIPGEGFALRFIKKGISTWRTIPTTQCDQLAQDLAKDEKRYCEFLKETEGIFMVDHERQKGAATPVTVRLKTYVPSNTPSAQIRSTMEYMLMIRADTYR